MPFARVSSFLFAMLVFAGSVAGSFTVAAAASPPSAAPAAAPPDDPGARLTPAEAAAWREDLAFMAAEMEKRHANLFHTVSRADFARAVADLDRAIPEGGRNDAIVGMMRLAALVGDGHTNVSPLKDPVFGFASVPVKFYDFDDGVHVWAALPGHEALLGARVVSVGGVPIDDVRDRLGELASRDNPMGERMMLPILLAMPAVLEAVGLSDSVASAAFGVVQAGELRTVTLAGTQVNPPWPPDTDVSLCVPKDAGWRLATHDGLAPAWLAAPTEYHRFVPMPDADALYVQLNMVTDLPDQTLGAFGEKILAYARAHDPSRIVLDVRLNRGGNKDLRFPFVASLVRAEDADTKLFVLVGRGSFSATQAILDDLSLYTGATLVGEPAASKPNSFGDSYRLAMPNSGLTFRTSIYRHQLDQRERPWTAIDLAVPPTFADYVAGRDAALEAALHDAPPTPLADELLAAARGATGAAAVRADDESVRGANDDTARDTGDEAAAAAVGAALADALVDPRRRYHDHETALSRAAFALAGAGFGDAGLVVAERAVIGWPRSPIAWTTLALLAHKAGRTERAIEAAEATLRFEPNDRAVRGVLGR